jgi:hypothetical protein
LEAKNPHTENPQNNPNNPRQYTQTPIIGLQTKAHALRAGSLLLQTKANWSRNWKQSILSRKLFYQQTRDGIAASGLEVVLL